MSDYFFCQNVTLRQLPQKIKNISFLLGMMTLLTGCSGLNSQFTCPQKPGVQCQNLDQVNALVDQGKFAGDSPMIKKSQIITAAPVVIPVVNDHALDNDFLLSKLRTIDHVIRLWIAPYIDTQGNYFSASLVYHMMERSQWREESIDIIREEKSPEIITTQQHEKDHV